MGADFYRVVDMMKARLGANAVPIQLPIGFEDTYRGMIDLIEMKAIVYEDDLGKVSETAEIPDDLKDQAEIFRQNLLDAVLKAMTN